MPIEIKELHIKAIVASPSTAEPGGLRPDEINKLKKEITREVTERLLKILKQKNER